MRRTVSIGILLGLLVLAGGRAMAQAQQYTVQDLGTLGGYYSFAYGINSIGQVVGNSETGFPPAPTHALLWAVRTRETAIRTHFSGPETHRCKTWEHCRAAIVVRSASMTLA